jgi:hypothetical protein
MRRKSKCYSKKMEMLKLSVLLLMSTGMEIYVLYVISNTDYYINGVNLANLGIRIQASKGVVDVPKLKKPPETYHPCSERGYQGRNTKQSPRHK